MNRSASAVWSPFGALISHSGIVLIAFAFLIVKASAGDTLIRPTPPTNIANDDSKLNQIYDRSIFSIDDRRTLEEPLSSSIPPTAPAELKSATLPKTRVPRRPTRLPIMTLQRCQTVNRTVTVRKRNCTNLVLEVATCVGTCSSSVRVSKRFPYLHHDCRSCQPELESVRKVSGIQTCDRRVQREVMVTLPSASRCVCGECFTIFQMNNPANRERLMP